MNQGADSADGRRELTGQQWVAEFAQQLGTTPPTETEFEALLNLAGVAAHDSERIAAPVACWLAARSGTSPADALAAAQRFASERT